MKWIRKEKSEEYTEINIGQKYGLQLFSYDGRHNDSGFSVHLASDKLYWLYLGISISRWVVGFYIGKIILDD